MSVTPSSHPPRFPAGKGTYILVLSSSGSSRITAGGLGEVNLAPGFYLYVGSARGPGGLRARLGRHLRAKKTLHWHIDYLSQHLDIREIWICPDPRPLEHITADALAQAAGSEQARAGFGSSDCSCPSHLFHSGDPPNFLQFRDRFLSRTGVRARWIRTSPTGRVLAPAGDGDKMG